MSKGNSKPTMKQGKAPVSEKQAHSNPLLEQFEGLSPFNDMLTIDPQLKKEIESQGLAYKFINYKHFKQNGNMHKRGYIPYKRQNVNNSSGIVFGSNPEGYIVRGDCVLAVIPKTWKDDMKRKIAEKTAMQGQFNKQKAAEMKKSLGKSNVDSRVLEGYEDNV